LYILYKDTLGRDWLQKARAAETGSDSSIMGNLKSIGNAIQNIFTDKKGIFSEKKRSTKSIAKLGMYVLLSYGFVSNFSYVTTVICAWIIHGKATGLSPLAAGQWKPFFAIYTGLWAANNFLRPVRFSVAVLLAPSFDRLIDFLENRMNLSKNMATALCVFMVNIVGTFSYLFGGLFIATKIVGVPLLAKV
jgi:hypothetical protein